LDLEDLTLIMQAWGGGGGGGGVCFENPAGGVAQGLRNLDLEDLSLIIRAFFFGKLGFHEQLFVV
jgi:hypothetical protein